MHNVPVNTGVKQSLAKFGRAATEWWVYAPKGRHSGDVGVWVQQEVLLGHLSTGGVYGDHRKAHLQHPGVHDLSHGVVQSRAHLVNSLQRDKRGQSAGRPQAKIREMFHVSVNVPSGDGSTGPCRQRSHTQTPLSSSGGTEAKASS